MPAAKSVSLWLHALFLLLIVYLEAAIVDIHERAER
jgi:hypothetical protein